MWHFILLPIMSAWVALLEADTVHVGQWMISRPILLGPLLGLVCGELAVGVALGVLCELLTLEAPPVGAAMPINGAVAVGCAVLMSAGPNAVPPAAALPVGLGLGAGHRWLETRVRQWRGSLGLRVLRSLEEEGRVDWEDVLLRGLGPYIAFTALFVYLSVALIGPLVTLTWSVAPEFSRGGLEFGFRTAPGIGLAVLTYMLMRKA